MLIGKGIAATALVVAMVCGGTQTAVAASCWQANEVSAAKVRDLQTRLMVAGLKCRMRGPEMLAAYNRFVVAHRDAIQRHNGTLRARFIRLEGRSQGERDYDRYTTALANAYGSTAADGQACAELAGLARQAAAVKAADLVTLAEDYGLQPEMRGGSCPMRMAASR